MTLCVAWIRQANNTEELIFATDSCLSGGEIWKHGIKLFELPRKDCLLCFTGNTIRAYPLLLNMVSSISLDDYLQSPSASLEEVLEFLSELFTTLVKTIHDLPNPADIHTERGAAKFLFGGWDWQKDGSGAFRLWKLYYKQDAEGFVFDELTNDRSKATFCFFLGEAQSTNIEEEAKKRFNKILLDEDRIGAKLDMEPLRVLREISLDRTIREVDGSLQIAKVYKSNRTEFFGIYWESSRGKPCFQGREYNEINKPLVRYFDPDTFEVLESDVPNKLTGITEDMYGANFDLVNDCYPDGYLRADISEKKKHTLRRVFKDVAYKQFVKNAEEQQPQQDFTTGEEV